MASLTEGNALCQSCRSVILAAKPENTVGSHFLANVTKSAIDDGITSGCGFCHLLKSIIPQKHNSAGHSLHSTYSVSGHPEIKGLVYFASPYKDPSDDLEIVSIHKCGFIHEKCRDAADRERCQTCNSGNLLPGPTADMALAKSWIDECTANHSGCSNGEYVNLFKRLPDIKFIDCDTMDLVSSARPARYCALSYVWGAAYRDAKPTFLDPGSIPNVIADAIEVTSRLGYRFLWVDQYCIPQDDPGAKMRQIAAMDAIYGAADVTIVAASGESADDGLPGVGKQARKSTLHATINGTAYVTTLADPHELVKNGKWYSRGWTWQEELLSTRVLYFTSQHMFFRCQAGFTATERTTKQAALSMSRVEDSVIDWTFAHPSLSQLYRYLIYPYSARELTFEADILTAFAGVLSRLESAASIFHLWGCPLPLRMLTGRPPVSTLFWYTFKQTNLQRRRAYPSWSWTGWKGCEAKNSFSGVLSPIGLSMQLEKRDGTAMPWSDFASRIETRARSTGTALNPFDYLEDLSGVAILEGYAAKVLVTVKHGWGDGKFAGAAPDEGTDGNSTNSRLVLPSMRDVYLEINMCQALDGEEREYDALVLGQDDTSMVAFLVVDPESGERVGSGSFSTKGTLVRDANLWMPLDKTWRQKTFRLV
ncbi:HET domain-containing protein [Fusarium keratoplasticum]|nr:HET domain-containing protein [Fusarium keratoplasticum]